MTVPRILIVGAGPAGTACAIRLRQQGISVTLAEQSVFPRSKACGCCLGGAGIAALQTLSIEDQVQNASVGLHAWQGSLGTKDVSIKLASGLAISRERLDPILLEQARILGATVWQPAEVRPISMTERKVEVQVQRLDQIVPARETFDIVVIAAGLSAAGFGRWLPWEKQPHGRFGVSTTIAVNSGWDELI
ncbi:MAG: FAD-dependent monooxygenase, partial [Planctomycetota bacterium]